MFKPSQHTLFISFNQALSPSTHFLYSNIPDSISSTNSTNRSQTFHFENFYFFPLSSVQPPYFTPIHNHWYTASLKHSHLHLPQPPPSPLPPHFSSTALYFYPHLLLNPNHHNPLQTHPPILSNFHVFQPKVPHHLHTSTHLHPTYHHVPSFSPLSLPYPFYQPLY